MNQEPQKRKTQTSIKVRQKYINKTYYRPTLNLRYDKDRELIEAIKESEKNGIGCTTFMRNLWESFKENKNGCT